MTRLVPFHWPQVEPDFEPLLHPSWAFDHPRDVVKDPDLTTYEKRAILSSWASDACAVRIRTGPPAPTRSQATRHVR